jgi:hypothetical protein
MFWSAGIAALVESATAICVSFSARSILPASKNEFSWVVSVILAGAKGLPVA